jgi:hypothetical protein
MRHLGYRRRRIYYKPMTIYSPGPRFLLLKAGAFFVANFHCAVTRIAGNAK